MIHSSTYFSRHKALENISEASRAMQQLIAASVFCLSRERSNSSPFLMNDKFQSFHQRPLKAWRPKEVWDDHCHLQQEFEETASSIVALHIECVFNGLSGVVGAEPVGTDGSYIVFQKGVFLHVWQSRHQAERFQRALSRAEQIKFNCCIPSPIHIPMSVMLVHQGVIVTVTWIPPLLSDQPEAVNANPLLHEYLSVLCAGLFIPQTKLIPLYRGADARLYILCVDEINCHALVPKNISDSSTEFRLEWMEPFEILPAGMVKHLEQVVIPACATKLSRKFDELPASTTALEVVSKRMVPNTLHDFGINLSFLHAVMTSPALSVKPVMTTLVTHAFTTEMVARTICSFLDSLFWAAKVPQYAASEIHLMQRIILANQLLDAFVKDRKFLADHIAAVLRSKYNLPSNYFLSISNINLSGVLFIICQKLNVSLDSTGKQIANFALSKQLRSTCFDQPLVLKHVVNLHLLEANRELERIWESGKNFTESYPFICACTKCLFFATVVASSFQRKIYDAIASQLDLLRVTEPMQHFLYVGVMAEVASSSSASQEFGMQHVSYLVSRNKAPFGDTAVKAERCRFIGQMLNGTKFTSDARKCFDISAAAFQEIFSFEDCALSSEYFELLLCRCMNTIKSAPIDCVREGMLQDLYRAALQGSATTMRKAKTAAAAFHFCGSMLSLNPSSDECNEIIASSTLAVNLHEELFGPMDPKSAAVTYCHLYFLVVQHRSEIVRDEEIEEILDRFRSICIEIFGEQNDQEHQTSLINSEWMVTTVGRLLTVTMELGLWDAAASILKCVEFRFLAADFAGPGQEALREPLRLLGVANHAASLMRHYFFRTVRRRWNNQLQLQSWIYRAGVICMEQMHWKTIILHAEADRRVRFEKERLRFMQDCSRAQIAKNFFFYCIPTVSQMAAERRRIFEEKHNVFVQDSFMTFQNLSRRILRKMEALDLCYAVDHLHFAYRQKVEGEERRAYNQLMHKIELNARLNVNLEEIVARRELYYIAAARVMQRILQSEMLLRVVPVLSLYFFTEEQSVRAAVEEEWATGMEELRLKERVFRIGAIKTEQKRRLLAAERTAKAKQLQKSQLPPKQEDEQVKPQVESPAVVQSSQAQSSPNLPALTQKRKQSPEENDPPAKTVETQAHTPSPVQENEIFTLWLSTKKKRGSLTSPKQGTPPPRTLSPINTEKKKSQGTLPVVAESEIRALWKKIHHVPPLKYKKTVR